MIRVLLAAITVYFLVWLLAFLWLVGPDSSLIWKYFLWSWTGGGEKPTWIQYFALSAAFMSGLVAALLGSWRRRT